MKSYLQMPEQTISVNKQTALLSIQVKYELYTKTHQQQLAQDLFFTPLKLYI